MINTSMGTDVHAVIQEIIMIFVLFAYRAEAM
jgi:hypothetical protein